MKITFVALNYAPSRGGAQELVRRVAEGLVARGHEVTVLTTDSLLSPASAEPGHIEEAHEVLAGVEVRRFSTPPAITSALRLLRILRSRGVRARPDRPRRSTGPLLFGPWPPSLIRAVWRATRTADVVIGSSAPFTSLAFPAWFRSARGAPVAGLPFLHLTGSDPPRAVLRALRRCDLVVACTEFEASADVAFGVDPNKVVVIPPGVAPDEFGELDADHARRLVGLPERPTVGFIGRLAAYKGVDTLVEAAPLLWEDHPDVTVLIAGSSAGWDPSTNAIPEAQHKGRLVVREGFSNDERSLLLSACDVVVHPSTEESFGLIALEAWAAHRPVVLGDIPAVRSFTRPGETAELVAPGDALGLASIVGQLLDDPARRARLTAAGYAEIGEHFDWERVCDAWHEQLVLLTAEVR